MSGLLTERIKAANKKKGILDIWGELKRGFNNNPRNAETMDAIFGLGGIVPGVGDAASGAEALYRYNQGDMLGSGLAGLGALPMVPSMAGMIKTQYGRIPESYADTKKLGDMLERAGINAGHVVQREGSAISPSQYLTFGEGDAARQVRLSNHADKNKMMAGATPRMSVDPETGNTYEQAINWLAENGYNTPLSAKYKAIPSWEQHYANMAEKSKNPEELLQKAIDAWRNKPKATRGPMPTIEQVIPTTNAKSLLSMDGMVASKGVKAIDAVRPRNALGQEIPPTPYELAHMEAQRVAALPVEQGGLGLPPNNTAMDRARAMGFDTDNQFFHGSRDSDKITKFTESNPSDWIGSGTYVTSNGEQASNYALYGDHSLSADTAGAPGVLPLFVNKSKTLELSSDPATRQQINDIMNSVKAVSSKKMAADFEQQAKGEPTTWDLHNIVASPDFSGREGLGSYAQEILRNAGYDSVLMRSGDQAFDKIAHGADHYTAFSPSWYDSANQKYIAGSGTNQLRSRFAAFNPAKRDSSDLLAGVLPYAAIGGLLGYGMYDEPDYGGY